MEAYKFPDQGLADMYLIQGIESKPQSTSQSHLQQFEPMYNEGVMEYLVDRGVYYPTASNYGYICTGLESPMDWEEHCVTFGQETQYPETVNENSQYVYYNPDYGYGQYPYNPYNPYIPGAMMGGAMMGVDGSVVGQEQYYAVPSYENLASSSAYAPFVLQPRPDSVSHDVPYSSMLGVGDASVRRNSFGPMTSEGGRANIGSDKQPRPSDGLTSQPPLPFSQVRGPQGRETGLHGKASWGGSQLKSSFTYSNGLPDFESRNPPMASSVHKLKPKILYDERVSHDTLSEHDQATRPNSSKGQLVVKALTKMAGNPDAQGNIVVFTDEYNKADFPIDYKNSKFFVIKSYSEDDVHKSMKYNVWSSTPNGNMKLSVAYEDAQRIGCPIFLFFSVNASGQFCGVAEMIGPVDFNRDMDFWQQDKWSGSFNVKWHIIKDLPNHSFRHIILENNENKPVTNSRDTQEIPYGKGLEMLKIYKNHPLKTSLLDDFMYYENRQRIMQKERARLVIKSYENPYHVPFLDPPRKLQPIRDSPAVCENKALTEDKKNPSDDDNDTDGSIQVVSADEVVEELKMSSLSISQDEGESVNFVTIGSMPVKVNGHGGSGVLTVGTIPLDPRALKCD